MQIWLFSPMDFPIRSPHHTVHGIVVFARVLDKIRLNASGQLPVGYHLGVIKGNRTFDDRLCKFLRISFYDLTERVLLGGSDSEIMEWCFSKGDQPDAEQIEIWNGFMTKRGWRDSGTPSLLRSIKELGLGEDSKISTFFELMDIEENHPAVR
jgi:Domain of unknown function (DUF5069)